MQWYEYFLFVCSCVHVVCITFQSGTGSTGPNFFVRDPDYTVIDSLQLALLVLFTCDDSLSHLQLISGGSVAT